MRVNVKNELNYEVIQLIGLSLFDTKEDQNLFFESSFSILKKHMLDIDGKGYGDQIPSIIQEVYNWLMHVLVSIPEDIAKDAIKFCIYFKIYESLDNPPISIPKSVIDKIKKFLEVNINQK